MMSVFVYVELNFLFRYYVYVQFCLERSSPKWPILCQVGC